MMGLTALLTNASRGRTRGGRRGGGRLAGNFLTPSTQSFSLRGPFILDKDGSHDPLVSLQASTRRWQRRGSAE